MSLLDRLNKRMREDEEAAVLKAYGPTIPAPIETHEERNHYLSQLPVPGWDGKPLGYDQEIGERDIQMRLYGGTLAAADIIGLIEKVQKYRVKRYLLIFSLRDIEEDAFVQGTITQLVEEGLPDQITCHQGIEPGMVAMLELSVQPWKMYWNPW